MKFLKIIGYIFLSVIYAWVSSVILVFHGPFDSLKSYVIGIFSTSMHPQYLAPLSMWTVSAEENKPSMMVEVEKDLNKDKEIYKNIKSHLENNTDDSITIENFKDKTYSAKIMLVPDPTRIRVAVTKYKGDVGQTVSEMVEDYKAIAGINGGMFQDVGYRGTGGVPLGTTIQNGQFVTTGGTSPIVGFTRDGILLVGTYTDKELVERDVTEALSFGPVLVKDGKGLVKGDGGWGAAPRTAIGQREDGTVIMIVTDGRMIHGANNLGATMKDLMHLMLKYGAVNAANLDGGSSATMVKDGMLINEPSDVLGERKIATSFIVMPQE
ncbi:phosphodiester glycosidase family protein [Neobacillus sp. SAB-20_R2A]|uniref:phosphodiester glycosidase family protein n=1 Tax=Neobacillus sp. SAB-20_R2A TaxID=3120519 RepID=UPI003C6E5CC6